MADDKRAPTAGNNRKVISNNTSAQPKNNATVTRKPLRQTGQTRVQVQPQVQPQAKSQAQSQTQAQAQQAQNRVVRQGQSQTQSQIKTQNNGAANHTNVRRQGEAQMQGQGQRQSQTLAQNQAQTKGQSGESNQNAKALLEELRTLMAAINASNKPMPVPIVHYGGNAFIRFLSIMTALFGMAVIGGGVWLLVQTLFEIPKSTAIQEAVNLSIIPIVIIAIGVLMMMIGMITKAVCDTADYNAQLLWLLKQRWERKAKT